MTSAQSEPICPHCNHPVAQHEWVAGFRGFFCRAEDCECTELDPEEESIR